MKNVAGIALVVLVGCAEAVPPVQTSEVAVCGPAVAWYDRYDFSARRRSGNCGPIARQVVTGVDGVDVVGGPCSTLRHDTAVPGGSCAERYVAQCNHPMWELDPTVTATFYLQTTDSSGAVVEGELEVVAECGPGCTGQPCSGTYAVTFKRNPPLPVCGDGVLSWPEECDDGNAAGGDGCSESCQLEAAYLCRGEPSQCSPAPACDGATTTFDGDVFVASARDWTLVMNGGCQVISGNLTLAGADLTEVDDSAQERRLVSIGGALVVTDTPALRTVRLPSLASVGSLEVSGNRVLASLELPSLGAVTTTRDTDGKGGMIVRNNWALGSLRLPALASAGGIDVGAGYALEVLELPALVAVGGELSVGDNQVMKTLDLGSLRSVARLAIVGNTQLPGCVPLAIVDGLRAGGCEGQAFVGSNGPAIDCPTGACETPWVADEQSWQELIDRRCTEITGNLVLSFKGSGLADPPDLRIIDGRLSISWGSPITALSLSALERAGALEVWWTTAVVDVSLPRLVSTKELYVASNSALRHLGLPSLQRVTDRLEVVRNGALPECEAKALAAALTVSPPPERVLIAANDTTAVCAP